MQKMIFNWFLISFLLLPRSFFAAQDVQQNLIATTLYGSLRIDDPLAIELINSPAMQRLKHIHQYGPNDYLEKRKAVYTRFDHSLGVYYILCKHGASRLEQIAGLLHDVSHTVFSHACDPLFMGDQTKGAYQDSVHKQFLERYGIKEILAKYGISVDDVMPKNSDFRALEQELPALCADRIEYNLYAAWLDDLLSRDEVKKIEADLHFDGVNWYFNHKKWAKKFALVSLHQTIYNWGSPHTLIANDWICRALKRAIAIGLIEKEDIFYRLTDDQLWQRLIQSNDEQIVIAMDKVSKSNQLFCWRDPYRDQIIILLKAKFRGVDPLVKHGNKLVRLSLIDQAFAAQYTAIKNRVDAGWPVVLHNSADNYCAICARELDPRLRWREVAALQKKSTVRFMAVLE